MKKLNGAIFSQTCKSEQETHELTVTKFVEKSYSKNTNFMVSISQINDWAHSFR